MLWRYDSFRRRQLPELIGKRIMVEIEVYGGIVYALGGDLRPYHGERPQASLGDLRLL